MPLLVAKLQSDLQRVFTNHGASYADCAAAWANALVNYFSTVTPASSTAPQYLGPLTASLTAAFSSPVAAPAMETAMVSFVAFVSVGMLTSGFGATLPVGPVGWAQLFAKPYPETAAEAAQKIASRIDAWARTGIATPLSSGPPVPWS